MKLALRRAWSTCRSARFRLDGSVERQRDARVRPARDPCARRRRLRRRGTRRTNSGPRPRRGSASSSPTAASRSNRRRSASGPNRRHRSRRTASEQPRLRSGPWAARRRLGRRQPHRPRLRTRRPRPGHRRHLEDLFANSNGSLEATLPPGTYRITAAGIPKRQARRAHGRQLPRLLPERRSAALARSRTACVSTGVIRGESKAGFAALSVANATFVSSRRQPRASARRSRRRRHGADRAHALRPRFSGAGGRNRRRVEARRQQLAPRAGHRQPACRSS